MQPVTRPARPSRSGLAVLALSLVVSACATSEGSLAVFADTPATGSIQPALLTRIVHTQTAPECAAIEASIDHAVQQMANKLAETRKQEAAPPANLVLAYKRMFGPPGSGNAAFEQYERERTRAAGFNAELNAKGCTPVDIDRRLAQTQPEPEAKPETRSESKSADAKSSETGGSSGFGLGQSSKH